MPEKFARYLARSVLAIRRAYSLGAPQLPKVLFCFSLMLFASLYTMAGMKRDWFPLQYFKLANKTASTYLAQRTARVELFDRFIGMTDFPAGDANRLRVRTQSSASQYPEHFLMSGDVYAYRTYCPRTGCLAAEFDRRGRLVHAYPYHAEEFAAKQTVSLPYEAALFDYAKDVYVNGLAKLPNGDLIVVFHQSETFPYGGGVARVDRDGHVIWFHHDYSNHWPTLLNSREIATVSQKIVHGASFVRQKLRSYDEDCKEDFGSDIIRIVDTDGNLVQEIGVLDALMASPYRSAFYVMDQPCDPTHVNYVRPVTPAIAAAVHGAAEGDLLVSIRNINAFAVIRRKDGKILQMFKGSFQHQHGVTPLGNSTEVVMFDNWGTDRDTGPSRLLIYDLATGHERVVVPNKALPRDAIFSSAKGQIDISADGSRVLVAVTKKGIGYEVRLADGAVLTKFDNLQNVSGIDFMPDSRQTKAARFQIPGIYYVQ